MEPIILHSIELPERFNEYTPHVLKAGFVFDEENTSQILRCVESFVVNQTGLMVIGNPGSGKTLLFEIMQRVINPLNERHFSKLSVLDVVLQFNNKEVGHTVFRKWNDKNVFFDDLGTEGVGYLFGEKVEVFEKFIQFRYDLFRNRGLKTHFTTNLSYDELKTRYGARCVSRLNEMCEVVLIGASLDSKDRRKLKNFIGLPPVYYPNNSKEEQEVRQKYELAKKDADLNRDKPRETMGQRLRKQLGTPKTGADHDKIWVNEQSLQDEINAEFESLYANKPTDSTEIEKTIPYLNKNLTQSEFLEIRLEELNKI